MKKHVLYYHVLYYIVPYYGTPINRTQAEPIFPNSSSYINFTGQCHQLIGGLSYVRRLNRWTDIWWSAARLLRLLRQATLPTDTNSICWFSSATTLLYFFIWDLIWILKVFCDPRSQIVGSKSCCTKSIWCKIHSLKIHSFLNPVAQNPVDLKILTLKIPSPKLKIHQNVTCNCNL